MLLCMFFKPVFNFCACRGLSFDNEGLVLAPPWQLLMCFVQRL